MPSWNGRCCIEMWWLMSTPNVGLLLWDDINGGYCVTYCGYIPELWLILSHPYLLNMAPTFPFPLLTLWCQVKSVLSGMWYTSWHIYECERPMIILIPVYCIVDETWVWKYVFQIVKNTPQNVVIKCTATNLRFVLTIAVSQYISWQYKKKILILCVWDIHKIRND